MHKRTFDRIREVVQAKSGIALGPHKEALVSARLGKRLRALGCDDYEAYLERIMKDAAGEEMVHLLDAISTNVTSFFRESVHFDFIREAAAAWLRSGKRKLRIWSAASSTGEEPYSVAMTLLQLEEARDADIRILATDLSTRVLQRAKQGLYEEAKIQAVPLELRRRFFERAGSGIWRVVEPVRRMASFHRLNLAQPPYPMRGPLDLVLCRNVMIYFDASVRARLLAEIASLLAPGGFLLVGHAESLTGQNCGLKTIKPSIYQKP